MLARTPRQAATPPRWARRWPNVVHRLCARGRRASAAVSLTGRSTVVWEITTRTSPPIRVRLGGFRAQLVEALRLEFNPYTTRSSRTTRWPSCSTPAPARTPSLSIWTATSGATSRSAISNRGGRREVGFLHHAAQGQPIDFENSRAIWGGTHVLRHRPTSCRCRRWQRDLDRSDRDAPMWRGARLRPARCVPASRPDKLEANPAALRADLDRPGKCWASSADGDAPLTAARRP